MRPAGVDGNMPTRGEDRYLWQGFDPDADTADITPFEEHPQVVDQSFLTMVIAGGNDNLFERNLLYDNWRHAFAQFSVPAFLREETDPERQFDTSHRNEYRDNRLDFAPDGSLQPNGDPNVWWDDQGVGNCWEGNTSAAGPISSNALFGLPDCATRSGTGPYEPFAAAPNPAKSAEIGPCAAYDRHENPDPPFCPWTETPARPE